MTARRRRTMFVLALCAAVLLLWPRRQPKHRTALDTPVEMLPSGARAAVAAPIVSNQSVEPEAPGARPIALLDQPPPVEYPPGSQPLAAGTDPSLGGVEDQPVDPESGLHVIFGPRRDVVHPPEPMIIDLRVVDPNGERYALGHPIVRFRSEREAPSAPGSTVPFEAVGRGAYVATFSPGRTEQEALLGYVVFAEIAFEAPNGLGSRRYVTSLHYSPLPGARLNGRFADVLADGSLVVQVGLTVEHAGHYKVIASLYGADGESAIAFAQNADSLEPGDRALPLQFFGKILRDRGLDGPYQLRYLMVFEEFPARGIYYPGATLDRAWTTRPWKAADFSPAPWQAPAAMENAVTAESPSQRNKPPPLFRDRPGPIAR